MGLMFWRKTIGVQLQPLEIHVRLPAPMTEELNAVNSMREERHHATMELLHASIAAEELSAERTRLEIKRTQLEIARLQKDR